MRLQGPLALLALGAAAATSPQAQGRTLQAKKCFHVVNARTTDGDLDTILKDLAGCKTAVVTLPEIDEPYSWWDTKSTDGIGNLLVIGLPALGSKGVPIEVARDDDSPMRSGKFLGLGLAFMEGVSVNLPVLKRRTQEEEPTDAPTAAPVEEAAAMASETSTDPAYPTAAPTMAPTPEPTDPTAYTTFGLDEPDEILLSASTKPFFLAGLGDMELINVQMLGFDGPAIAAANNKNLRAFGLQVSDFTTSFGEAMASVSGGNFHCTKCGFFNGEGSILNAEGDDSTAAFAFAQIWDNYVEEGDLLTWSGATGGLMGSSLRGNSLQTGFLMNLLDQAKLVTKLSVFKNNWGGEANVEDSSFSVKNSIFESSKGKSLLSPSIARVSGLGKLKFFNVFVNKATTPAVLALDSPTVDLSTSCFTNILHTPGAARVMSGPDAELTLIDTCAYPVAPDNTTADVINSKANKVKVQSGSPMVINSQFWDAGAIGICQSTCNENYTSTIWDPTVLGSAQPSTRSASFISKLLSQNGGLSGLLQGLKQSQIGGRRAQVKRSILMRLFGKSRRLQGEGASAEGEMSTTPMETTTAEPEATTTTTSTEEGATIQTVGGGLLDGLSGVPKANVTGNGTNVVNLIIKAGKVALLPDLPWQMNNADGNANPFGFLGEGLGLFGTYGIELQKLANGAALPDTPLSRSEVALKALDTHQGQSGQTSITVCPLGQAPLFVYLDQAKYNKANCPQASQPGAQMEVVASTPDGQTVSVPVSVPENTTEVPMAQIVDLGCTNVTLALTMELNAIVGDDKTRCAGWVVENWAPVLSADGTNIGTDSSRRAKADVGHRMLQLQGVLSTLLGGSSFDEGTTLVSAPLDPTSEDEETSLLTVLVSDSSQLKESVEAAGNFTETFSPTPAPTPITTPEPSDKGKVPEFPPWDGINGDSVDKKKYNGINPILIYAIVGGVGSAIVLVAGSIAYIRHLRNVAGVANQASGRAPWN